MKVQRLASTGATPFHAPKYRTAKDAAAEPASPANAPESALEREFAARWARHFPDLPFEREVVFLPPRKFRADFWFGTARVAVEINGGIWRESGKGAHTGGSALSRDYERTFIANCAGIVVFPLTDKMARDLETLTGIADLIRRRIAK